MDNTMQVSAETILFARHCQKLLKEKKIKEAIDLCEKGVRNFPFYAEGHYILGRCYQALGQIDDAKNELERTLFYAPIHLKALNSLAIILYKKKLKNIADEYLLTVALNDPLNFELHEYLKAEGLYSSLYPPIVSDEISDEGSLDDDGKNDIEITEEPIEDNKAPEESTHVDIENLFINSATEESVEENIPEDSAEDIDNQILPENVMEDSGSALELDESRQKFEVNSIIENISEVESNKLDLSQYANIEDDFSTLLSTMEQDFQASFGEDMEDDDSEQGEDQINPDMEQLAEEKPFGNTAILFNGPLTETESPEDVSNEDIIVQQKESEEFPEISLLEEEISDEQKPADIDLGIQGELINESEIKEEDKFKNNPDELSKIINQLEKRDDVPPQKVKIEKLEPDIVDENDSDNGNINEIMNNSSLVTPTFGEILIAQKKFEEARTVFVQLANENPDNERYKKKLQFLDKLIAMQK